MVLQEPACDCGEPCLLQEKALVESRARWLDEELGRKSELLASERRATSEQVPGRFVCGSWPWLASSHTL